ncbi:MAG: response regulator, partial [Flavobacteriales bacterium]
IEKDNIKIEQQASELRELNEFQTHFFVNITHELRTPLTLIKGHVSGIKKTDKLPEIHQKADKILTNSNKIENLINDIIDVSKAETNTLTLHWEQFAINQLIQKQYEAFKSVFEERDIRFEYHAPNRPIYVEVDKLYFERVMGNILVNAAKYTPVGGCVTISITETNDKLNLNIIDDGIGLALGEETKIFNRFYQVDNDINKASGSGIGLAFCKEVVQLLKGKIKATQNKEKGTTFSISLPKAKATIEKPLRQTDIEIDSGKPTVLLVEDNVEMREYLNSILTDYNLIEAGNGEEALELLKHHTVDALVTDYMMPKMDGYELIERLKEEQYTFPILVITARADVQSKLNVLALGIDDYLTKPFIEQELLYRLQNSLANAKSRMAFRQEIDVQNVELEEEDVEESELILKSRAIVEKNIANSMFGVPDLVEALQLTERTLYRKLKATSGLTPNQFIREIKLLHVRTLVEQNKAASLHQLSKNVGLKNTSHLQKLYKERFGAVLSL